MITVNPQTDDEGFLCNHRDWSAEWATATAAEYGIALSETHWEILRLAQQYFADYAASPGSKLLVRYVRRECGPEKGSSIYLMQLFGGRAAKTVSLVAGLPKPEHCL